MLKCKEIFEKNFFSCVCRWIKYEQVIDHETNMWSKPFVGALVHQSLLYLKTGLQYGTVLLDAEHATFGDTLDEMIRDFINSGHMYKEQRESVKRALLSKHKRSSGSGSGGGGGGGGGGEGDGNARRESLHRKKSVLSDFFVISMDRRRSTFTALDQQTHHHHQADHNRKSSAIQLSSNVTSGNTNAATVGSNHGSSVATVAAVTSVSNKQQLNTDKWSSEINLKNVCDDRCRMTHFFDSDSFFFRRMSLFVY